MLFSVGSRLFLHLQRQQQTANVSAEKQFEKVIFYLVPCSRTTVTGLDTVTLKKMGLESLLNVSFRLSFILFTAN